MWIGNSIFHSLILFFVTGLALWHGEQSVPCTLNHTHTHTQPCTHVCHLTPPLSGCMYVCVSVRDMYVRFLSCTTWLSVYACVSVSYTYVVHLSLHTGVPFSDGKVCGLWFTGNTVYTVRHLVLFCLLTKCSIH